MLSHRICQRRALIYGRRLFRPSASEFSSSSSSPSYYSSVSRSFLSDKPNSRLDFNFKNVKGYCFSAHPVLNVPVGNVVEIPLAQTGEGIAECELLKWYVQEGDFIEDFQPLCEVQSDKATIEITSRYKGKVCNILHVPGDIVKVGATLLKISIDEPACSSMNFGASENAKSSDSDSDQISVNESAVTTINLADSENVKQLDSDDGKGKRAGVLSTPAVRCLAKEHEQLHGAEEHGCDVKSKYDKPSEDTILPLRGFQRAMIKSMSLAAKVPHFHYVDEINCDALVELKTSFQKNNPYPDVKHTFLPILIKSLSMAIIKYPSVNSRFKEDAFEVILKGSHNIGIAMATQHGLVVPNIKNVQSLSISEITKELARLQQLASDNKLTSEDICGGTITLSNIGAIGGKFGSPLLNLPEVSIIAIGRIQKLPRFTGDGSVYPASLMTVNIGADHRVLDGATVARFCNEWKKLIENPELLTLNLR
ncbi:unnamed protein product [Vicia faba]|uniref:Dihydrolipoamide acetyltransferase component of pyruvate dehydrogenase complex n=1 Tax=Vicia faba TaxID=3906 RepID=A0AAV1AMP9_VICFA|nr:unnamed protein product [Vicia faba]